MDGEIKKQVVITRAVRTPDGLAFDWIHKNLYYTDTGHNTISVISVSYTGKEHHKKTLFSTELDEPRAIVVDPRYKQGWMYWSDWGEPAKIEKAGLDGSQRTTLVSHGMYSANIEWPNGLTIGGCTVFFFFMCRAFTDLKF